MLPLSVPALAAFAIFQFLWVWNDLLVALVFLGAATTAVMHGMLTQLVGSRGQQWHLLTAGAFVTMILPLLVFLALQRYFVRASWPAPSSRDTSTESPSSAPGGRQ